MQARRLSPQYKIDTLKVISGGRVGGERGGLDVALKHRIKCGGWWPAGRLDESGKIPDRYPLKELKKGEPEERTLRNVQESEGTIVIYFHELSGGTAYTAGCCIEDRQPHRLIDAAKYSPEDAATVMISFFCGNEIDTRQNPCTRESEWVRGHAYCLCS